MSELIVNQLEVALESFRLSVDSIKIPRGTVLGLMGKSGTGKSTFLQAIAGFVPLMSGTITVSGKEITALPPEERKVSLVFQRPWLFENRDVLRNVSFGLELQGNKMDYVSKSRDWLKKMEISELEARRTWEISGGQAQRVALARALAVEFPVLLLDEPFSALDAPLRRELRKVLLDQVRQNGIYTILVSHDSRDMEQLSDQLIVLDEGKILASGTYHGLKNHADPNIRTIFEV